MQELADPRPVNQCQVSVTTSQILQAQGLKSEEGASLECEHQQQVSSHTWSHDPAKVLPRPAYRLHLSA